MKKIALITGAGTGIGRALCERLITKNHEVFGVGRRMEPLNQLKKDFGEYVTPIQADVGMAAGRQKIASALKKRKINILVHNAAILSPAGPLSNLKRNEWQKNLQINLEGPLFLTQKLLSKFQTGTRILHVSSGAAHHSVQGWAPYCISKAALLMSYQCWKEELSQKSVLIGSVKPGVVDTPMQEEIRNLEENEFPMLQKFRSFKENNELLDPKLVSRFITWLLLESEPELYSSQDHDVRDETLKPLWIDFQ